jgi:hypothetical protein
MAGLRIPASRLADASSSLRAGTPWTVETFRGSNAELQAFVVSTWSDAYQGKMTFPVWSSDYFDWQFNRVWNEPDRRLAIYDGDSPVAVLLGTPSAFCVGARTLRGAHWSWMSIAKSHRGFGLAKILDAARVSLEQSAGSDLIVSYRFTGSSHSLAERPSNRFPLKQFARRVGFWVRPLDGARLRRWNPDRVEGLLSQVLVPLLPRVTASSAESIVRPLEQGDLSNCVNAARHQFSNCDLQVQWTPESLTRQLLGSHVSRTLVVESHGVVCGFINYHILPFEGMTTEPVAIIDLLCINQLSPRQQTHFVRSALSVMRDQGAVLVLKLRTGDAATVPFLRNGFIPRLADSSLVLQWPRTPIPVSPRHPVHTLWR